MRIYFLVCESKVNTLIWIDKGQTKKSYKKSDIFPNTTFPNNNKQKIYIKMQFTYLVSIFVLI
jgi:hypothetical protein